MTFQIVPDNDLLIYYNGFATDGDPDPYDNFDGGQMLGANTSNITGQIGVNNYDIGHVFSTGGGGLAGTDPCSNTTKGRGVTGIVTPEFDPFDIDYVSHEIGHQYGAGHTYYNACFGSKVSEDYEPGSASTIMGYAGICVPNVQENSDAYFHASSINQISISASGDSCYDAIAIGNDEPTAVTAGNYTIPILTPFILDATGSSDPNGDTLTYCWEQFDNDGTYTQPPVASNAGGPMFRTNFPTIDPIRTMPNLEAVINNTSPTWEVLPSNVGRTLDFRLTVRDNNPLGGQTAQGNIVLTVGAQGPFEVTSPNAGGEIWYAGSTETITWDVNSTNVLSAQVNILLSTDGGYTYPITLASNVNNDGVQDIVVPDNVGTTNRIKIEAAANIFFDLSNADFEIKAGTWEFSSAQPTQNVCQPTDATYTIDFTPAAGYTESVTFSASGQPAGTTVSFSPTSRSTAGPVTMTISNTGAAATGNYLVTLTGTSGTSSHTVNFDTFLNIYDASIGNVVLTSPADGAGNQSTSLNLGWDNLVSASSYDIQISTFPNFSILTESGSVSNATTYATTSLTPGNIYYWRVRPNNPCSTGSYGTIFSFQTANDVCITYDNESYSGAGVANQWEATGTNAVSATVDIPDNIVVTDVQFYMRATHGNIQHLKMQFSAPSGRFAEIYNRDCPGSDIDVTFSDSGTILTCGNVDGSTNADLEGVQQAGQLFTRFHGENAQGVWTLLATDRTNGTGGTFNEFNVQICGELQIVNDITVTNNNLLNIGTGATANIPQSMLLVAQPGATATQLTYVITSIPTAGDLTLLGTPLNNGDMFTQDDIDNGDLSYTHGGVLGGADSFNFTVLGNNSAILGGQVFNILAPPVTAPPTAVCQDITVDIGSSGTVSIVANDIDNGSSDDQGIVTYSIDIDTFTCAMVGTPQTVTLTVTDNEGQTDTCTSTVTVTNNNPPTNVVISSITVNSAVVSWDDSGADSYEVDYRENGTTPWTTVSGITGNSTSITGLMDLTMYDVRVRAICNATNSPYSTIVNFTTLELIITYCSSYSNDPASEYITNVTLADTGDTGGATGINNTSGSTAYSDFTTVVAAELEIGTTPTISITRFIGGAWNEATTVWIDYNRDGDFEDAGERVVTYGASQTTTIVESFDNPVPIGAAEGDTRMRVAMRYFGTGGTTHTLPCEIPAAYDFGEVEDYTVTIVSPDPCPVTNIYTGTWSEGTDPTASEKAVFNSNFTASASSIEACTVEIMTGVTVTINAGQYLRAQGNIVVNGTLIVEHEGSLVQVDDASTITKGASGVIEIRKTTLNMKPRDFMFMSSPMIGETRDGVYGTVNGTDNAFRVINLNPANFTVNPAVSGYAPYAGAETFLSVDNTFLGNYTSTEALTPGEGLIVYPQPSFSAGNQTYNLTYTKGTPNNGVVTFPIIYNGMTEDNFNLIGNPYASAIDIVKLMTINPMINEVYFWEHVTTPNNSLPGYLGENPSMQDFSMRNLTTGMAAVNKPGSTPSQFIASGQGFAIKADQAQAATTTVTFNNDMRVTGNNDQYRSNASANDLLWLQIENAQFDLRSKAALGFLEQATEAIDRGYDSKRMATPVSIYTSLRTNEQLGIQGRESFDSAMIIPVGFATAIEEVDTYTISLSSFEGENLNSNPIYLVDLVEQRYVNLKEKDYVFSSHIANTADRFTLMFEAPEVLGVEAQGTLNNSVSLYPNPTKDQVTLGYAGSQELTNASILDVNGKMIKKIDLTNFSQTKTISLNGFASGVYFVQINGTTESTVKKLIIQ
jgi:subtilisin-like proprotein convertase family protein